MPSPRRGEQAVFFVDGRLWTAAAVSLCGRNWGIGPETAGVKCAGGGDYLRRRGGQTPARPERDACSAHWQGV
jgi:hypothetical protein